MLFTLKRPKSERYSQLSFLGFKSRGRNALERFFNTLSDFFAALRTYVIKKIKKFGGLVVSLVTNTGVFLRNTKSFAVRKLIWSRGKLGRPIATVAVTGAAFAVFLFGEVFNSTRFVSTQEVNADYLTGTTDIIAQRNIATTTIPEDRKRSEPFAYTIESGDTLSGIGARFRVSADALRYMNDLPDDATLKPGQTIVIPPISGLVHTVESGDTLLDIAKKYDVPAQAVADFNYIINTSTLAVGTELVIPGATVPQKPVIIPIDLDAPLIAPDAHASKDLCVWPTTVRLITQGYTWYHNGVDIAPPIGAGMPPIYACTEGKVVRAGWDPFGLGLRVLIEHNGGYETLYGHMSRIDVGVGDTVSRGQSIGRLGNTGRSTGPHVHFMVKFNGVSQNPLNYMR